MATDFPTSLDSLQNPSPTDKEDAVPHSAQHANANDAIEALQAKVGIDGSGDADSLDYKVAATTAHLTVTTGAHDAEAITLDSSGMTHTTANDLFEAIGDLDGAISGTGIQGSAFTAAGSLLKGTGTSTSYTELARGSAHYVLAVNASGSDLAYRDAYALPQAIDSVQVDSFTVALDQVGQWVPCEADDSSARVITLPRDSSVAIPYGTTIMFEIRDALAEWTFSAGSGATILAEEGRTGDPRATGQGAVVFAFKTAADTWRVTGALALDDVLGTISDTGVWVTTSGSDSGQIEGGELTASTFRASQDYTQTQDPLPYGSGGTSGVYFLAEGTVQLDYTGDALVGPVQATAFWGPRAVFENEITQVIAEDQFAYGHGPIAFMDAKMARNIPGETRRMTPSFSFIAGQIAAADGGAVTLNVNDAGTGMTAYADNLSLVTAGSGSMNAQGASNNYEIIGFDSTPIVHGNVSLQSRIGMRILDITGGAGTGAIWDAVAGIGGRLTNTVDDTTATIDEQYGVLIPRLTKATSNVGISCDSQLLLWSDTATITANVKDHSALYSSGTITVSGSADIPPRFMMSSATTVVNASLNVFAASGIFSYNNTTLKSAANATARDFKQIRSYIDQPTFTADTSADTAAGFTAFYSFPTFSITNSGSLSVTESQLFYAGAAAVGAGVTITTHRGVRIDNPTGSGTVTNAYGLTIARISKGATKNRAIQINRGGFEIAEQEASNETSTTNLPSGAAVEYTKGNKWVKAMNVSGTIRYTWIDMSANGNNWVTTTSSAP